MGDNQTTVLSYSAKPGEMIRMSEHPKIAREISQTLTKSDGKLGDNTPTVIAFAQNTREEVRSLGNAAGALSASSGTHQSTYVCVRECDQAAILHSLTNTQNNTNTKGTSDMMAEVRRLTPNETDMLMGFPKGYTACMNGDSARYSADGNSWASNCARAVIKGVHKADATVRGSQRAFKYGTISSGIECHSLSSNGLGDAAVFFSEISPAPVELLKDHYPNTPILGDMTLVDYDSEKKCIHNRPYDGYEAPSKEALGFEPFKTEAPVEIPCAFGEIDLVSGGTPCQDLSVAGKRKGAVEGSNTRSSLAFQLPRIGSAVGARFILWENVAGAFSSNGGKDFAWLIHRMTEYGYTSIAWRTLDAQYVRTDTFPRAVPQRRRRIWLVGYRGDDWRVPCEALFENMKALGSEPPKRTVGVGYISRLAQPNGSSEAYPAKSEKEEFIDFIGNADKRIIDVLEKNGVCETVAERMKELEEAEKKRNVSDCEDLFGLNGFDNLFGAEEDHHQGRDLKAADVQVVFPSDADIRSLGAVRTWQFARSVCQEVLFCGELFKRHEGAPTVDDLDPKMLDNIGNAGFLCNGFCVTMKMPEWNAGLTQEELRELPPEIVELYDGDVCGLSDLLEEDVDPKFRLSWRACYGILRRAVNRGKKLPIELGYALVERMMTEAGKVKWFAQNGKDTVKKEGDLSERAIAQIAYDTFVEPMLPFESVEAVAPKAGEPEETEDVDEGEDLDDGVSDPDSDEIAKIGNGDADGDGESEEE